MLHGNHAILTNVKCDIPENLESSQVAVLLVSVPLRSLLQLFLHFSSLHKKKKPF